VFETDVFRKFQIGKSSWTTVRYLSILSQIYMFGCVVVFLPVLRFWYFNLGFGFCSIPDPTKENYSTLKRPKFESATVMFVYAVLRICIRDSVLF